MPYQSHHCIVGRAAGIWLCGKRSFLVVACPPKPRMEALKRSLGQSGEAPLQKRPRAANRNTTKAGRPAQAGGVMAIQLPLPARWAQLESRRSDPRERLTLSTAMFSTLKSPFERLLTSLPLAIASPLKTLPMQSKATLTTC